MLELKLSELRKWTGYASQTKDYVDAVVKILRDNKTPLGLLVCADEEAILQNAPCECVEVYLSGVWKGDTANPPGFRAVDYTYRLHAGVTVVDDTAEESGYEFVEVKEYDYAGVPLMWFAPRKSGEPHGDWLTQQASRCDYICTEIEDANKQTGYIDCWAGPYTQTLIYASIIEFTAGGRVVNVKYPLKPTRVVFRKGD